MELNLKNVPSFFYSPLAIGFKILVIRGLDVNSSHDFYSILTSFAFDRDDSFPVSLFISRFYEV